MPEVSQDTFQKHAERLWNVEANANALPDSPEKDALQADLKAWHTELADDAKEAGFLAAKGGTDKNNDPGSGGGH